MKTGTVSFMHPGDVPVVSVMHPRRPPLPLASHLVLPTVGLVLAAVVANAGFAAVLAVRRADAAARVRQAQVARALEESRVAVSPPVLDTLRRLTGSHFVVWDSAREAAGLSTLPADDLPAEPLAALVAAGGGTLRLGDGTVHAGLARASGVRPETILVLTPQRGIWTTTLEASWPVLAVGCATLAVLVPLGLAATTRLGRQISLVEGHVARIAGGDFGATLADGGTGPPAAAEIERLVAGVDSLSTTLAALRSSLVAGERQRLLGQLAAGFAHELRNAIAGARFAIDLHQRRCRQAEATPSAAAWSGPADRPPAGRGDESLAVAIRQLDIVAAEVRGLLALGRPDTSAPVAVDVVALVDRVCELVALRCAHAGVHLERVAATGLAIVGHPEALRAALVNLVLNAIDATGRGGRVWITADRPAAPTREAGHDGQAPRARAPLVITVEDDGPGPPPELAATICEPFVTGKPEGVGLGLAVAATVAEQHGGRLAWSRAEGRTRFTLTLPAAAPTDEAPP